MYTCATLIPFRIHRHFGSNTLLQASNALWRRIFISVFLVCQHTIVTVDYMTDPKDTNSNTNNGRDRSEPNSDDDSSRDTSQEGSSWREDRLARSPERTHRLARSSERSPKPAQDEQGRVSNRKGNAAKGRQSSPPGTQDIVDPKESDTPTQVVEHFMGMNAPTSRPNMIMIKPS